ncbi:hypothetical protein AVEN_274825-1 [Araneus ventricosus]|uniref:BZIP domain-containing protein n=1 Tax=Araneus ventricosus TaxID=182803 RepID=A0A4Y2JVE8_ARAVE|nr:hypothetical protein AVEN_274825-1 [Araneus ventricosus]
MRYATESSAYETTVYSVEDLEARLVVAAGKMNTPPGIFDRVRQSFLRRCELCNDTRGRHFEHLLHISYATHYYKPKSPSTDGSSLTLNKLVIRAFPHHITTAPSPVISRALASTLPRRPRSEKRPIPEEQKDDKYFERRKRNNLAAKKSRDARKAREDEIALRACFLEKENAVLRAQVNTLREEAHSLRQMLMHKRHGEWAKT